MKIRLAIVLSVAFLGSCWWLLRIEEDPATQRATGVRDTPPPLSSEQDPAARQDPSLSPSRTESHSANSDPQWLPPPSQPTKDRVHVFVDQREQPLAAVWWLAHFDHESDRGQTRQQITDPDHWPASHRFPLELDQHASAAIPAGRGTLVAFWEGQFATKTLHSRTESGDVFLTLKKCTSLRAVIVDSHGRPCPGIPVQLCHRYDWDPNHLDGMMGRWTSGLDGVAILPQISHWIGPEPESGLSYLQLGVLGHHGPAVPLDPDALPREALQFTAPPTGSLEVCLVDHLGNPVPFAINAFFSSGGQSDPELWRGAPDLWPGPSGATLRLDSKEGKLHVPFVAVGSTLSVSLKPAGGYQRPIRKTVQGPTNAGELTRRTLSIGALDAGWLLQLVDAGGQPLSGQALNWRLSSDQANRPFRGSTTTGANGQLFVHRSSRMAKLAERTLRIEFTDATGQVHFVATPVHPAEVQSRVDLGTLEPIPLPALLRGRVVDENEVGVAGVTLKVAIKGDGPSINWAVTATSDEQGNFALYADSATSRSLLFVSAPGHATGQGQNRNGFRSLNGLPFAHGDEGLVVQVKRGRSRLISILLPPDCPADTLSVKPTIEIAEDCQSVARGPHRYEIFAPADEVQVAVHVVDAEPGRRDPVHTCTIPLPAPGDPTEPYLLDLRESIHLLRVDVIDTSGNPLGVASLTPLGGSSPDPEQSMRTNLFGRIHRVLPYRPTTLRIEAPGHRPTEVPYRAERLRVILEPGPRLRVRPTGSLVEEAGDELQVHISGPGIGDTWSPSQSLRADKGDFTIELRQGGSFKLRWTQGSWRDRTLITTTRIEVPDDADEQLVEVELKRD